MAIAAYRQSRPHAILAEIGLVVLVVWTLAPLFWMISVSLKEQAEVFGPGVGLWPQRPTLDNYRVLIEGTAFPIWFRNSVVVAVLTTGLSLVLAALAAYALTRLEFRGRRLAARGLVCTYLMPHSLLFIPLLSIIITLGLANTHAGLVLAYLGFTVPFCTWLLMGYFMSIPIELEEAGLVDGCSRLGVLVRIILPLTLPALAVVAFFSFTQSWNEFIYASVIATDTAVRTLPTGIPQFIIEDVFFWGPLMAATVLGSIPPLIVYFVFQRFLITGLTLGAVKG